MSRRPSLSGQLYHLARTTNTLQALLSGNPNRIARRTKNIIARRTGFAGGTAPLMEYHRVEPHTLWHIARRDLPPLKAFVERIVRES